MHMKYTFSHKIDRKNIPTCRILGVEIADLDMAGAVSFTKENIKKLSGDYCCVSNVHTTVTAYKEPEYLQVQNGGIMALPDGGPLSYVGRRRGHFGMKRVTGPDYMKEILNISVDCGYSHFFYGSTEATLDKLKKNLLEEYPGLQIAGMYSPPFRPLTEKEDLEIIQMIEKAKPDFLWIGLGAPKQEYWMADHQGKVSGFMVGVGAAFDYLAGNIKRAPEWMQKNNLEWLYRLCQEPGRLLKRYVKTNFIFIIEAVIKGK